MSEELKPCPFCGREVKLTNIDPNDTYYMIECQNEDCNAATCFGEVGKEQIKKRWNRRGATVNDRYLFKTQSRTVDSK